MTDTRELNRQAQHAAALKKLDKFKAKVGTRQPTREEQRKLEALERNADRWRG